ncbi:MAG: hypothetical protein H7138_28170 [Myxococcales bacterium]|nr:hypothetical protein [Myxococcales bacterium]
MNPQAELEVLHVLERMPSDASGALVRERPDGTMAGALLVERGRVCWAMSERYRLRLTDILVAEQDTLSITQLNEVFAMCHRDHMPLGETLVERGLVSLSVLHRALLRHTCEALDYLVREDAPWSWIEHSGYGYHPMLTFSPAEVLAGVRAIASPTLAARARTRLRSLVRDGQRGFAVERGSSTKIPLAQVGCEGVDPVALADLAIQAEEVMVVAATIDIEVALAELGGLACASWAEENVMFVLLCDGDLAFNRLLAQIATMKIPP